MGRERRRIGVRGIELGEMEAILLGLRAADAPSCAPVRLR